MKDFSSIVYSHELIRIDGKVGGVNNNLTWPDKVMILNWSPSSIGSWWITIFGVKMNGLINIIINHNNTIVQNTFDLLKIENQTSFEHTM